MTVKHFVRFDGQTWPVPDPELANAMRYGDTEYLKDADRLRIASLLDAYALLIWMPEKKRRNVVREIRRAR